MKIKEKIPEGWIYTSKTLINNIKETGILHHYYYEPVTHSIYQIINIKRKYSSSSLELHVRFVNPEDPIRIKVVNVLGSRQKSAYFNLADIFNDKELRQIN